jgi:murein DD-endopeptidase MepM/ murein hydrolase activator NlpD
MKSYLLTLFTVFAFTFVLSLRARDNPSFIDRWQLTDTLIRDNMIAKDAAIDSIKIYVPLAVDYCKKMNVQFTKRTDWVFPISGYTATEYRSSGNDYIDDRFDYFQGGEYHGHPAHDIFILDNDSNGVEDATGKRVDAVAMASGIIISVYSRWTPSDMLRSGNYVKLFDPESKAFFYYSHLDSVSVKPGQIVTAGEKVGTVGRTGRKAFRGRTHLHIAYYRITGGYPLPVNIIKDLRDAEERNKENKK